MKQLEESQEIKNKDIEKIFLQLTGFSRFLKLKAELIAKLEKPIRGKRENKVSGFHDKLGLNRLGESHRKELID